MPLQSNIKYAIIAGGIALAIAALAIAALAIAALAFVAGVTAIGTPLNNTLTSVAGSVK